jgi:hypothetical protein
MTTLTVQVLAIKETWVPGETKTQTTLHLGLAGHEFVLPITGELAAEVIAQISAPKKVAHVAPGPVGVRVSKTATTLEEEDPPQQQYVDPNIFAEDDDEPEDPALTAPTVVLSDSIERLREASRRAPVPKAPKPKPPPDSDPFPPG